MISSNIFKFLFHVNSKAAQPERNKTKPVLAKHIPVAETVTEPVLAKHIPEAVQHIPEVVQPSEPKSILRKTKSSNLTQTKLDSPVVRRNLGVTFGEDEERTFSVRSQESEISQETPPETPPQTPTGSPAGTPRMEKLTTSESLLPKEISTSLEDLQKTSPKKSPKNQEQAELPSFSWRTLILESLKSPGRRLESLESPGKRPGR